MNIVIAGAGEVGFHIAEQLILENKDVVLIERNPERAKYAATHLDCIVHNIDATSIEALKEAGLDKADVFISATDFDEVNLISCLIVGNEFDIPVTIARVRRLDYSNSKFINTSHSGISCIVNPDIEAARAICDTVQHGASSDIFIFSDSDLQLRDIFVDEGSFYENISLKDLKQKLKEDFIIAGVMRGDEVIIPSGDTVLKHGDHVFVVARDKIFQKILSKTGNPNRKLKNIIVVGGGKTGKYVAERLLKMGRRVKIVEKDYDRCKIVAEELPGALVIHGDISDNSVYEDEQLELADIIITTTQNEELNILTATYAKSLGVKRAVALVNKTNYLKISDSLGIDATVSPKISSVNAILKFMRSGNVRNVFKIFDGRAEVVEMDVAENAVVIDKALKNIKLPKGALVVAVNRGGVNHIPNGNFTFAGGDRIITFSVKDATAELEKIFAG